MFLCFQDLGVYGRLGGTELGFALGRWWRVVLCSLCSTWLGSEPEGVTRDPMWLVRHVTRLCRTQIVTLWHFATKACREELFFGPLEQWRKAKTGICFLKERAAKSVEMMILQWGRGQSKGLYQSVFKNWRVLACSIETGQGKECSITGTPRKITTYHLNFLDFEESQMGVDAISGRFPICPEMSRFVPICPLLSRFGARNGDKSGQKRTNGDKTGHFGTNWETPPFSIYPHLALLKDYTSPFYFSGIKVSVLIAVPIKFLGM